MIAGLFKDFNPQVPCGTRQGVAGHTAGIYAFQSTGPLRDPTILSGWNPRTAMGFQSTGPLRDPTRGFLPRRERFSISIHRSLAGPDRRCQLCRFALVISIHRSLAGPDRSQCIPFSHLSGFQSTGPLRDPTQISQSPLQTMLYFNPQVPCGTRRWFGNYVRQIYDLNTQVPSGTRRR